MSDEKNPSGQRQQHRAWGAPRDVPKDSGVGQQIQHLQSFVNGEEGGPDFARGWLAGRRSSLGAGERLRAPLQRIFDDVFYVLEEYVIDPDLRDDDDMSDDALLAHISSAAERMDRL